MTELFKPDLLNKLIQTNLDRKILVAGLQNLGHIFRSIGKLEDSKTILYQALQYAKQFNQPTEPIILSIANTHRAFFSSCHELFLNGGDQLSLTKALYQGENNASKAFQMYDTLSNSSESEYTLSAKINWLSQYAELIEWLNSENEALVPVLAKLEKSVHLQAEVHIKELLQADYSKLTPIDSVFNRLRISRAIILLSENQSKLVSNSLILEAFNQANIALETSRNIGNQRAQSETLGMIGKLYEHNKQIVEAQDAFEQANGLANSLQSSDLSYQWQWALGRLLRESGKTIESIKYYQSAIKSLDQVRDDLLFVNSELDYSFHNSVEPVYKEYIALLLLQPSPELPSIIETQEKLQATEVENYLQCGKLNLIPLSQATSKLEPKERPSVFYILDLDGRYAVIVTDPNDHSHFYFPNHQRVLEASNNLNIYLSDRRFQNTEPNN